VSKLSLFGGVLTAVCMTIATPFMTPLPAQDRPEIEGRWAGYLDARGTRTHVTLTVRSTDDGYSAVVESYAAKASTIPVDSVVFLERDVRFELPSIEGSYLVAPSEDGTLLAGMWTEGADSYPLILARSGLENATGSTTASGR
jgi:hypothetical protein